MEAMLTALGMHLLRTTPNGQPVWGCQVVGKECSVVFKGDRWTCDPFNQVPRASSCVSGHSVWRLEQLLTFTEDRSKDHA